jgi:hypothetical protein
MATRLNHPLEARRRVEVISAVNENQAYLCYVPYFIDFWLKVSDVSLMSYKPRVYLIMDEIPIHLELYSAYIVLVPSEFESSAFASQNVRTLATMDSDCDLVITSDIDMLPLSSNFFDFICEKAIINPSSFIVGRHVLSEGQYPICYNVSSPRNWRRVLGEELSTLELEDRVRELSTRSKEVAPYLGIKGGSGWYFDQEFLFTKVNQNYDPDEIIRLTDAETNHNRLDRAHHKGIIPLLNVVRISRGFFADYHLPRMSWTLKFILSVLIRIVR